MASETIKQQIIDLLTDNNPDVRRHSAEELANCNEEQAITALTAALWDENKGVRDAASRSLCVHGCESVVQAVADFIRDENITARNLARELLENWGKDSVPALLPYINDPSHDVRKFALDLLGLIGNEKLLPHILPLLRDPDENVVLSAVEALGNIGSPKAASSLCPMFDEKEFTQAYVAEALGKIGGKNSCDFLLQKFKHYISNPSADPLVMFTIIEALGQCGNKDALQVLQNHINDVKGRLRKALMHTIIQISERLKSSLQVSESLKYDLLDALQHDDMNVKMSAVKGLAHCIDAEVIRTLIYSLGLSQELDSVIFPIIEKDDESFSIVTEMLEGTRTIARNETIILLGKLAEKYKQRLTNSSAAPLPDDLLHRAFDLVAQEWNNAADQTRGAIIDTLFHLDGDRAVEFLEKVMNDLDSWLRIHIIELLATIADRRAIDFISRYLEDDDEMVRKVAATTLKSSGYSDDPVTDAPKTSINKKF
ncbi:MAG: HEAT repeat domain-containing protein [Ignavibacteria bacterium]|nr:HEAT repeat domain-containing protein [Ignavibacteria bacterium]